jgi:hypothetical protein
MHVTSAPSTATYGSTADVGLALTVAAVPPVPTGAVQMLISVLSEAVKCVIST